MRNHAAAAPLLAISFTIVCGLGQVTGSGPAAANDLERVLALSNRPSPAPYRALRRIEGGLQESDKRGWLEASTEFDPARGLRYEVLREGGSEYVRKNILVRMLATEQQLLASGKRLRASLDAGNYDFSDGGVNEAGLQQIVMRPVKKSDALVNGRLFLDPATQLMTRIEGRLVKSPSFWLRDVDVSWNFAQMEGHLMPVEMSSTGRVRMFGRSNFRMVYKYQSIDGRAVQQ
ncbi:MAG TPA: hypothetical protein VNT81_21465 [Vicinamibacterales bacterium]|nr:hypothetical protein [Vicinamibacterales bacterium]